MNSKIREEQIKEAASNPRRFTEGEYRGFIEGAEFGYALSVKQAEEILVEALEEFKLGHEHKPDLPHTRAMGDTYGWCDHCSTKVSWGPGEAEQALEKWREVTK